MKKKKKAKRLGSLAVAFAMTTTTVLAAVPAPAEAAGEFTGTLASADSAKADGNVVNVSFNGGEVTGRITFLEDGIFQGGITYRAVFPGGMAAGEAEEQEVLHYMKDTSQIMYVTYDQE